MKSTIDQENSQPVQTSSADTFVMKCGGSTLAALPDSFFEDLKNLQDKGLTLLSCTAAVPQFPATWRNSASRPSL